MVKRIGTTVGFNRAVTTLALLLAAVAAQSPLI